MMFARFVWVFPGSPMFPSGWLYPLITSINSSSAGDTLTFDGTMTVGTYADIYFEGAGDTTVNSSFGNGDPAPVIILNALNVYAFDVIAQNGD